MSEPTSDRTAAPHVGLRAYVPGSFTRRAIPVSVGVPFARGILRDASALGARRRDGSALPIQIRTLDRWSDGSIRWALLDLCAEPSATDPVVEIGQGLPKASMRDVITAAEGPDGTRINTGAAILETVSDPGEILRIRLRADTRTVPLRLMLQPAEGDLSPVVIDTTQIEERGPLRLVLKLEGHVRAGDASLDVVVRLHAFAGLSALRCDVTVRNPRRAQHDAGYWDLGDAGSVLIRRWTLQLGDSDASYEGTVRASLSPEDPLEVMKAPFQLHQASSGGAHWDSRNHVTRSGHVAVPFRGYRGSAGAETFSGFRASPIVITGKARGQLAMCIEQFWQNFPMAVRSNGAGIEVGLFEAPEGAPEELQAGEQKTHTVWLLVGEDPLTDLPLAWAREPMVLHLSPEDYAAAGAIPYLIPEADASCREHLALVRAAVEGPNTFDAKREVIDEYGWRHFGEIYGDHEAVRHTGPSPLVSHYNNQYDPIAGFAAQFMRSAAPVWWRQMRELASHVVDIDIYHTDADKAAYNRGLFWHTIHYTDADTATHRTYPASCGHGGGPSSEHNYPTGLMLAWFLTGEARYRDAALDLAHFPIRIDDGGRTPFRWLARGDTGLASASATLTYQGPGRGSGNSLNALMDGYRLTGDRAFLDKAEQIIRRVVHPNDDVDRHALLDAERRWFYTMFLQALGKYLDEKAERGEIDRMYGYAQTTLLRYARWMAEHEHPYLDTPEKLEFPTETWAAQDMRKCDVFNFARMHASDPAERARFGERSRFFFSNSVATLSSSPTRDLARPVIVLLTSGWTEPWFERHPDAMAPRGPAVDAPGRHVAFEPQRVRAMRRARGLVGAAAVASVVGLGWALLTLFPRIGFL
jgi:hypothetical protein